ncbi:methyltransferase [Candidatus Wolfebacteria bacterium]|nr:MAG: methyltransferase [Candidatus Wolfebacteria bacterium]
MKKEIKCDLCNHEISEFLDLGNQPLANKYPTKKEFKDEDFLPLKVLFCKNCKNVQLGHKVSRERMFENYYYLSSVNEGLVRYFEGLAEELKDSDFLLDVGSNDGILLKPLRELGVDCIGVDPSDVAKVANDAGLETIVSFFDSDCVDKIIKEYRKPDCIVCSSTFTHLEDPHDFIKNLKNLMTDDGKFLVEVEYVGNFIKNIHFERFYLDRVFYYSVTSLKSLFKQYEMDVVDVEEISPHGGSLKLTIMNSSQNIEPSQRTINWLKKEESELTTEILTGFKGIVKENIVEFKNKLQEYKDQGLKVCGYGSPARLSCICNYGNIDENLIKFTVDDSPLKNQGFKHTPGTHIPIVSREELEEYDPDVIVMFAYEYFEDIKNKLNKEYKFLLPIPPKEIDYYVYKGYTRTIEVNEKGEQTDNLEAKWETK